LQGTEKICNFVGRILLLLVAMLPMAANAYDAEIDGSVLMLFAQILVYAGSIFGVKIYIKDLIRRANK